MMGSTETTPLNSSYGAIFNLTREESSRELAKNWGWIQLVGILNVVCGILALLAPIVATEVAYVLIVVSLLFAGILHISGFWYAEAGHRIPTLVAGIVQVALAVVLQFHPVAGLTIFTIVVAVLFLSEGFFRIGLACQNRDMPGWGWTFFNGLSAATFSVVVMISLDMTKFYTLGILLGVNLLVLGMSRIALAQVGRSIANATIDDAAVASEPLLA